MAKNKGGAPKGGRVHIFPISLRVEIKQYYNISYCYDTHNYFLQRKQWKQFDCYTVLQTSLHCWRLMYHCKLLGVTEYHSFKTLNDLLVWFIRNLDKRLAREKQHNNEKLYLEKQDKK